MPLQHDEESARIAAHHLPHLVPFDQFIIAALSRNQSREYIASATGYSLSHVNREIARLTGLIVIPLGYTLKGWAPGVWAGHHWECCLPAGASRLEQVS